MLTTKQHNLPPGFRVARVERPNCGDSELGMISSKIPPASAVYFGESTWESRASSSASEESIP